MSYSPPATFITGAILTAPQMQTIADDLTDLDRRTSPSGAVVAASETTSTTSYTNLATTGPAVTVVIGATGKALVSMHAALANANVPVASFMGFAVSGATSVSASDSTAIGFTSTIANSGIRTGTTLLVTGLNAGSTTFTAKYRTDGGGTMTAVDRRLAVTPLGS